MNTLTINKDSLKDINDVTIDESLTKSERIRSYIQQIGNPYCYKDGDTVVKISFSDTDITLEERLKAYICGII